MLYQSAGNGLAGNRRSANHKVPLMLFLHQTSTCLTSGKSIDVFITTMHCKPVLPKYSHSSRECWPTSVVTTANVRRSTMLGLFLTAIAFAPSQILAQNIVVASNYDGTNFNSSAYGVGCSYTSGNTYGVGASFTVGGAGDYNITKVIMPLMPIAFFGGNPWNYQLSIVNDVGGMPVGDVVGSLTPIGPYLTGGAVNLSFGITGVLHGGMDYWLLYQPIAPDPGLTGWSFSAPPSSLGVGYLAQRSYVNGVPTGDWTTSSGAGSVQPAFLIEGIEVVPEPECRVLMIIGLAGFMICFCLRRNATSLLIRPQLDVCVIRPPE